MANRRYGIQTTSDNRFNLYSTDAKLDFADKSEDKCLNELISMVKTKCNSSDNKLSAAQAAEVMAERLIINAEAHCSRTTEALLDPRLARYVVAADQCQDGDRVQTSKLKGTDYLNIATANQICLFDHLANMSKLLRLIDLHHKLKLDRDAFHNDKRTSAEIRILNEVKTATARGNVLLRKMLKMERRVTNIEKLIDALFKTVGSEGLMKSIADAPPEPIPEENQLEEEADVELTQEIIRIQNDGGNDDETIEDEDELMEELFGNVTTLDPDSSLMLVEEKDLTPEQILYRKRYEKVAEAKEVHGFHVTVGEGPFSHQRYSDLMSNIEKYNFTGLTEVGPPISQDRFKDRYKFYWQPNMKLVSDFDKREKRISQPKYLKAKIKQEAEEGASTSTGLRKQKGKGKKSFLKPVKEVPEPEESPFDFEVPDLDNSPTRKRPHGPSDDAEPKNKKPKMGIKAKRSWYK